jgi:PAS domain S-box-containing protein
MDLSLAGDLGGVTRIVRRAARDLTGADGATFVLREGEVCHYLDEDAIGPLWKGRRFPSARCISGWAMEHRQAAVVEDVFADPRIPVEVYETTFVRSLLMVPIRMTDPLGAIGAYWAQRHRASPEEVGLVQALADSTAVAIGNVAALSEARRWRALLAEASDTLWIFDPSRGVGETQGVRKWWSGITGRPEHDYEEPAAWIDDLHPEDQPAVRAAWAASTDTATPIRMTYRLRGRDGSYRHLAVRGVPVTRPNGTHEIVGMTKDVTRENEAETEVRILLARERHARDAAEEARRMLDQHLHRVSDGFVAIDRDWRYTYVNHRGTEILGKPREQVLGQEVWALFPRLEEAACTARWNGPWPFNNRSSRKGSAPGAASSRTGSTPPRPACRSSSRTSPRPGACTAKWKPSGGASSDWRSACGRRSSWCRPRRGSCSTRTGARATS